MTTTENHTLPTLPHSMCVQASQFSSTDGLEQSCSMGQIWPMNQYHLACRALQGTQKFGSMNCHSPNIQTYGEPCELNNSTLLTRSCQHMARSGHVGLSQHVARPGHTGLGQPAVRPGTWGQARVLAYTHKPTSCSNVM